MQPIVPLALPHTTTCDTSVGMLHFYIHPQNLFLIDYLYVGCLGGIGNLMQKMFHIILIAEKCSVEALNISE